MRNQRNQEIWFPLQKLESIGFWLKNLTKTHFDREILLNMKDNGKLYLNIKLESNIF